jgi:S-adenosylmethionine hydrolase
MHNHISLLTDYGTDDEFVGVMKSVIFDMAPHVHVTDITHGITPFDVRAGSLALTRAIQYVPAGIVIAIVDPGVGSQRKAIAVEVAQGRGIIMGPDNGLVASAVATAGGAERVFSLSNNELHLQAPGATFAGRDIFAPVAAFLCNGGAIEEIGEELDAALIMPGVIPLATPTTHPLHGTGVKCEVIWVDRFGNCQLNIGPEDVEAFGKVLRCVLGEDVRSATVESHYAAIAQGGLGAVIDSYGMVSICMNQDSAAANLRLGVTDSIEIYSAALQDGADVNGALATNVSIRTKDQ